MKILISILIIFLLAGCATFHKGAHPGGTVWNINNLNTIGNYPAVVLGSPRVIDVAGGKAVEFDGEDDALFLEVSPLAGAKVFTAEVIFCPYEGGRKEQRFFHIQENGGENRILFETRLTDDKQWFLDTYIRMGDGNYTLYAEDFKHPLDKWYHAAIVVDGKEMRHYVNGLEEVSRELPFTGHGEGKTSIGVRINRVHWFKGAIRKARFTPRVLSPAQFLKLER